MNYMKTAVSLALVTAFATQTTANESILRLADAPQQTVSSPSVEQQHLQQLQVTHSKFAKKRAGYQALFNKAYAAYPTLPNGLLESLAYVATRWEHRLPDELEHKSHPHENHQGMPQTYGVFGLYDTDASGFINTLEMVANSYGVSKADMLQDPETYVLATAAYIEQSLVDKGLENKSIEFYRPILASLSGIEKTNQINQYAINSFVFDAFNVLEKGHDDNGIMIKGKTINWNKAFSDNELKLLNAPGLFIDAKTGDISLKAEHFERDSTSQATHTESSNLDVDLAKRSLDTTSNYSLQSTDYPPAAWVSSPNYSSRNDTISHVAIHTMQGSYSGSISWFQNPNSNASAHYMVRSSDGQVTQMVRESHKAWHAKSANPYSIGIEHEGYVSNPAWYTEAMYQASADITSHICSKYNVNCGNAYSGSAHSTVVTLSQSYTVKGHQHFPSQNHTDPGINWNWSKYANMVNGGSGGGSGGGGTPTTTILDSFESSEGHFNLYPTYSGSTVGISSSSTAVRTTSVRKNGIASEQIKLVDNTSTSSSWSVRFLSGSGRPSSNTSVTVQNGRIGFWVYSGGSGMSAGFTVDDGSGTEKSTTKSIPAGVWTFLEWNLDDSSQWNAWAGSSNGRIDASSVTIDAIWFHRAQTSYNVYVYIDDVQHNLN